MDDKLAEEITSQCKEYDGKYLRQQLEQNGYVVVPDVVPVQKCDEYIGQYKNWLSLFGPDHNPSWTKSIIQHYRVAHCEPTWKTRLWAKPVFASIWKTNKLLSSMDGIAIGEPPELGRTTFREPGYNWFHIDQGTLEGGSPYLSRSSLPGGNNRRGSLF
ncbi:hypothetical protein KUTeg_012229 [Tegillarca granosa]|uniref:Phytanoyl-CoA dioxygenase n=1 Tax=Tegillarca granosa TaxID=220873 RepID=A0ABQ9EZ52_TEGGR|nr:hypothetical protein KUTeg_012229 [Tegillarca granosa]